jgi:hypothetical protein
MLTLSRLRIQSWQILSRPNLRILSRPNLRILSRLLRVVAITNPAVDLPVVGLLVGDLLGLPDTPTPLDGYLNPLRLFY